MTLLNLNNVGLNMIEKIDECFNKLPIQIIEGIETTIKLINNFKDYDDEYYENWTFLLFPILNSLEGFMKLSLSDLGIKIKHNFYCFYRLKDNEKYYKLNNLTITDEKNKKKIKQIENCYNIYVNHRHKYFHYQENIIYYDRYRIKNKKKAIFIFNKIYISMKEMVN